MQPRAHYRYELDEVRRALAQLADAVEEMLARALRAFRDTNTGAAHDTHRADDDIDDRRYALEERVIGIIAAQQPLASDLRFLMAAVQVATELERIGDYADGIATLVLRHADTPAEPPPTLWTLVDVVRRMLQQSVAAFLAREAHAAEQLEQADDEADALFAALLAHTQAALVVDHVHGRGALYVLFVAHNLERIADRAVNIAERATFVATGALQVSRITQTEHY
jgi:phosphate transport system protein